MHVHTLLFHNTHIQFNFIIPRPLNFAMRTKSPSTGSVPYSRILYEAIWFQSSEVNALIYKRLD